MPERFAQGFPQIAPLAKLPYRELEADHSIQGGGWPRGYAEPDLTLGRSPTSATDRGRG